MKIFNLKYWFKDKKKKNFELTPIICRNIIDYLKSIGYSQRDIAKLLGKLDESIVSKIYKGEVKFTFDHLCVLSLNSGISLPDLFTACADRDSIVEGRKDHYDQIMGLSKRNKDIENEYNES